GAYLTLAEEFMKRIAIIGAGLIGQSWAIVFARAGYEVRMWDGNPQVLPTALQIVTQQLQMLHENGLVEAPEDAAHRVQVFEELETALEGVIYVQESLPENLDIKKQVFASLDAAAASDTILASSTSSIPASHFTESLPGRGRCLD